MDNTAVANRYGQQAEAKLEMAGFLISREPAVQCNDRGNRHVTVSHDITRAKDRAAALQAATGCATIPTVATTVIP